MNRSEDEDAALGRGCDLDNGWRWRTGGRSEGVGLESRATKVSLKHVSWPTNVEVAPGS